MSHTITTNNTKYNQQTHPVVTMSHTVTTNKHQIQSTNAELRNGSVSTFSTHKIKRNLHSINSLWWQISECDNEKVFINILVL